MINWRYKLMLKRERKLYFPSIKYYLKYMILREHEWYIWKFQKYLRYEELCMENNWKFIRAYFRIKKNKMGVQLGFLIPAGVFDEGLHIWHYGNIIVNGYSKVGKNCILHGDNCIGNDGKVGNQAPIIGDNVDIGVGAKILGGITIGNGVTVGAGAVIVKSCGEGVTLLGVPGKSR